MAIGLGNMMTSGASAPAGYGGLASFGNILGVSGVVTQAIGAYASAKSAQYQLKSQKLDLEFQATIAGINARAAEFDAELEIEAGKQESGRVALQYRQLKASEKASAAARGVDLGVGSTAEVLASIELAKDTDRITINANAVRRANAARARGVNERVRGLMASVGAAGAQRMAGLISPFGSAATSLIGGAGEVARNWAVNERANARYRGEY